jgi:hypothetical protein
MGLNMDHVESMVTALQKNATLFDGLPIKVWKIGEGLMIVDGFHRFEAFSALRFNEVPAEIYETKRESGMSDDEHLELSRSEALQYAIKANQHNGSALRRSQADNQRAIRLLLENPMTRKISDASIAETVGVKGPTVAKIRKEKPEYQTDERIGSDGRIISRKRNPSKAGSNLSKKAARVEVASISSVADRPKTLGRDMVDDGHDLSGTRDENDATLSTVDAQEVNDFRDQFDAPVDDASHANLDNTPTTLHRDAADDGHEILGTSRMIGAGRSAADEDDLLALYEQTNSPVRSTNHVTLNNNSTPLDEHTVQVQNIQPQASHMTEATFSAADAAELRLFREHFAEIRQSWMALTDEILERYDVDLTTCDLREFGKATADHTLSLNQQVKQLKKQLQQANPVDPVKPAAELKTKPEPAAPEKVNNWEERLLAISPIFKTIMSRVREGISKGWDWRFFSNNRAWKQAVKLAGKPFSNDAATLIQSLLKGDQQD